ncbi:MAG TPA: hypothetical protein GXX36_02260 [Clostridiaceae bacterium]|nr:hypothetical protein [Clostridiaceae bacterium]
MRCWRAGSITLGLALLAFGITMLVSNFTGVFTLLDIVRWWPVLLIVLGCEVLASLFLSADKPLKVKFDVGSVFLIAIIVAFSMAVSTVGFMIDAKYGSFENFKNEMKNKEVAIFQCY